MAFRAVAVATPNGALTGDFVITADCELSVETLNDYPQIGFDDFRLASRINLSAKKTARAKIQTPAAPLLLLPAVRHALLHPRFQLVEEVRVRLPSHRCHQYRSL